MTKLRSALLLITDFGGGDWPPAVALACGLGERGVRVTVLCDDSTEGKVAPSGLPMVPVPPDRDLIKYWRRYYEDRPGEHEELHKAAPNPLVGWARDVLPFARDVAAHVRPDLIISPFFCSGLADALATEMGIPWCFVNPGCYFGEHAARPLEEDWSSARAVADMVLPLLRRADIVLHATDPTFDLMPSSLEEHHHFVGFLFWEPASRLPGYLASPGDPWALVTLSMFPQPEDLTLARLALQALSRQPVRALLTLSDKHPRDELGEIPANARIEAFVPHTQVLQRSALVVSHAGHGIVSKALYNGVPMVLVPWGRDQPGVAVRAERLGVARVVSRAAATADSVRQAVEAVLHEPAYRTTADSISARLKETDGVAVACQIVQSMFGAA